MWIVLLMHNCVLTIQYSYYISGFKSHLHINKCKLYVEIRMLDSKNRPNSKFM